MGAGIVAGMADTSPHGTIEMDRVPADAAGAEVTRLRTTLFERDGRHMTARQSADLRSGLLLLRAAFLPDHVFDDHASGHGDNASSIEDRIEIVAAIEGERL